MAIVAIGLLWPAPVYADGPTLTPGWFSNDNNLTISVAWGDVDGDGDLDLAEGNYMGANKLYLNEGGALQTTAVWTSNDSDNTYSIAWGDVDGDGDLDLAAGNGTAPNKVYLNEGGVLQTTAVWTSTDTNDTFSIAWGDVDGDGDLDLAAGNYAAQNKVYLNEGGVLQTTAVWTSNDSDQTYSVTWGDVDGDGDLDLVAGNDQTSNKLYLNEGGTLQTTAAWTSNDSNDQTRSVAWGDVDGDGDLDLAAGNNMGANKLYLNGVGGITQWQMAVSPPAPAHEVNFYGTAMIQDQAVIPLTYTLVHSTHQKIGQVAAFFSLDGGDNWQPAVAAGATITTNLGVSSHVYNWDVYESGVFGQSDNVVVRMKAYPLPYATGITNTYHYTHSIPGPYLWPYASTTSFPFRVRGTQVQVLSDTVPMADALVYRLNDGRPFADNHDDPFRTDQHGYLQGRGKVETGDQLVALLPISLPVSITDVFSDNLELYYTNATPTPTGLSAYTVTQAGVQTLTVSADYPLLLFNLDVSLEWDAREDSQYMSELQANIQRTSEFLYDWSNGQAALGKITIYHNREHWLDADVRVYATNRLRPVAAVGGITTGVFTDPLVSDLSYAPGQIRMGSTWNRYGNPDTGNLGEDWSRTLAHELGHMLFFLDDHYLGLDSNDYLIPVFNCFGPMSDPYREDYSEFHPGGQNWLDECQDTLAQQETGRWDWTTITTMYPWLNAPASATENSGPNTLPLQVTQISVIEPNNPPETVEVPNFYTQNSDGSRYLAGASGQAYLFEGDRMTGLGSPSQDRILARGAEPGDRVCLFEPKAQRVGCKVVSTGDEQLTVVEKLGWQPEIILTPVNSRTITINVSNVPAGLDLRARLYPVTDPAEAEIVLTPVGQGYEGTFLTPEAALEGFVHIWVADDGDESVSDRREAVAEYTIGGNPGRMKSGRMKSGRMKSGRMKSAPVASGDGQAIIYGQGLDFAEGEFYALQAVPVISPTLPWAGLVGQGYRLLASANAPDITDASISFTYLGSNVPVDEESWLDIYYYDGADWQQLETVVDEETNSASARAQGEGLYALMSTLEISLSGPGWNLFGYGIQETRPVTEALVYIDGKYSTVYGYVVTDSVDPWKVFDVSSPPWVNDLSQMEFSEAYWINITDVTDLRLKPASDELGATTNSGFGPPATYYGAVETSSVLTPTAGMTVTAWVDGNECGLTRIITESLQGQEQLVYTLNVVGDSYVNPNGCGATGRTIEFTINSQVVSPTTTWNSDHAWELTLNAGATATDGDVYLPVIVKNQ